MIRRYFSFVVVSAVLLLFSVPFIVLSQESSSRPDSDAPAKPATAPPSPSTRNPAPDAPSAALRDLLAAACAHDEPSFEKFLTARNAQSFSQLAPTARTELMKRFVLSTARASLRFLPTHPGVRTFAAPLPTAPPTFNWVARNCATISRWFRWIFATFPN
jgi:hypothetical protein